VGAWLGCATDGDELDEAGAEAAGVVVDCAGVVV
jgi:hypothetical protein